MPHVLQRFLTRLAPFLIVPLAAGCSPSEPVLPTEPPLTNVHTVTAIVYYDENGNGIPDAEERSRISGVRLTVLGTNREGASQAVTGQATIPLVPAGEQTLMAREDSLPPYFEAKTGVLVSVPQSATTYFPLTLPIGENMPHRYMAFGDSITDGEGGYNDTGYREQLARRLQEYFGYAEVINAGWGGTYSWQGAARIDASLERWSPAYTLIMYGTNDWVDITCLRAFPCFTIESLRTMVRRAKAARSLPFVATIPPTNPEHPRSSYERNEWVARMNVLVRQMVLEEGAVLVEVHNAMVQAGNLSQLFYDHVHPNDRGYDIITDKFFAAITRPRSESQTLSASTPPGPPTQLFAL